MYVFVDDVSFAASVEMRVSWSVVWWCVSLGLGGFGGRGRGTLCVQAVLDGVFVVGF